MSIEELTKIAEADHTTDSEGACPSCHAAVTIGDEYEATEHGYCWPCSAKMLDTVLRVLPTLLDRVDYLQQGEKAQMSVILHTIGGTVEGRPTLAINYLQRLRELVKNEASVERQQNALNSLTDEVGYVLKSVKPEGHWVDAVSSAYAEALAVLQKPVDERANAVDRLNRAEALVKQQQKVIEAALRIESLWLINPVHPEHVDEAIALGMMRQRFLDVLEPKAPQTNEQEY